MALPVSGLLSFSEAEALGQELHDRWALMAGDAPPLRRDDYGWGDVVQFIVRRSREIATAREADGGQREYAAEQNQPHSRGEGWTG